MKLKQLESILGYVSQFSTPKIDFEQYPTGPHIASRMLYTAENSFGDISDKVVADFGCGCGTLGIAAVLLNARHVIGIDIDSEALEIAQSNILQLEIDADSLAVASCLPRINSMSICDKTLKVEVDLLKANIKNLTWRGPLVDTVVMNPPFGTRKKGADMEFLSTALKVAGTAVYSLHKSSTREHVKRGALRDFGARSAEVLCELRFDIPASYKFHKKREVDISVDLWRFTKS